MEDFQQSVPIFKEIVLRSDHQKYFYWSTCRFVIYYIKKGGYVSMQQYNRRVAAVKTADAINAIEGCPVSDYAKKLSVLWARGELTGEQMKEALLISHRKMAAQVQKHV